MTRQQSTAPESAEFTSWFDLDVLHRDYDTISAMMAPFKQCLADGKQVLAEYFSDNTDVTRLLEARSWLVDQVLVQCWSRFMGNDENTLALVAVGGYGRSELMPGSDVDLMLLLPEVEDARVNRQAEALLTFLWDIGLEVGHSVRTITDCIEQSLADITVVTNLMESRLLAGSTGLFAAMQAATAPGKVWNSRNFFEAKVSEQRARHHKYHDSGYNLEPNIKEGPGGSHP